ncbi:MAG: 30S ribosomal protein S6 [Peptococcaceae bacterium]|jgi:small subunit ribosomal protein S6|nr:30S ribosomal protein S6 [Peptococcaceae bacterium]
MQAYEILYIIQPDLDEEAVTTVVDRFTAVVTDNGGEVVSVDKWGKRRLAYEIKDHRDGYYVLMNFNSEASAAQELERLMKISDQILRFLTTRKES